jgi:hypothetical protein
LTGYLHDVVNHTKKDYARGEGHENRAECQFSLLKPFLRVVRGISKTTLPGYLGFFQCLRNFHQLTAFEQGRADLVCGVSPGHGEQGQAGRFCQMPGSLRPSTNRHKWSDLCRTTDENGKKTLLILAWKCATLHALPSLFQCRCKAPLDRLGVPWRCGDSQHFPVPHEDLP